MTWNFTIRYVVLPSEIIFNLCGPESVGPAGWDEATVASRKRRALQRIKSMNDRSGFYTKLEESVLKEGVRNPILVSAGWCPEYKTKFMPLNMQEEINEILICDRHGGSRLWAAQKNGLQIPCIVTDYVNRFPKAEALEGEEQVRTKFIDQPKKIKINDHGVHVGNLPHIHLDETK